MHIAVTYSNMNSPTMILGYLWLNILYTNKYFLKSVVSGCAPDSKWKNDTKDTETWTVDETGQKSGCQNNNEEKNLIKAMKVRTKH